MKDCKWIETFYINKKSLFDKDVDDSMVFLYNLSQDTSGLYINSFVLFNKKLVKQLSIKNLTFN